MPSLSDPHNSGTWVNVRARFAHEEDIPALFEQKNGKVHPRVSLKHYLNEVSEMLNISLVLQLGS
jgi:hypothetical protein